MGLFDGFRFGKAAGGPSRSTDEAEPPIEVASSPSASENDDVVASYLIWSLARPPIGSSLAMGSSPVPEGVEDSTLVSRVQAAYRAAMSTFEMSDSFWDTTIGEIRQPIHEALLSKEPATMILRNPAANTHFWGFDAICKAPAGQTEPHELVMTNMQSHSNWQSLYGKWLHDSLVSLAEAVGAQRVFYPETIPGHHYAVFGEPSDVDKLLDGVEGAIGKAILFPNPYAGELGLASSRGFVGFRSLQAIYQAWRLTRISAGREDFRVIEIGAGLGRTAYFARQFGLRHYTIVDIPLTNAAQGYFLGRTLGPDNISMFGETSTADVRILPPQALHGMTETFDLMLNVDSFTEMSVEVALDYWNFARSNTDSLLSINHELNSHPVRFLYRDDPCVHVVRHPYWMRRGYVEEHVTWPHRKARSSDPRRSAIQTSVSSEIAKTVPVRTVACIRVAAGESTKRSEPFRIECGQIVTKQHGSSAVRGSICRRS